MSTMTQKMSESARTTTEQNKEAMPKKGDLFRCEKCGMEVEIKKPCGCEPSHVHLECCGQELKKA